MPASPVSASNPVLRELERREAAGDPIRVAIIGAGAYGQTLVGQLRQIPGMRPSIVCDLELERAADAYVRVGHSPAEVTRAARSSRVEERVPRDLPVATADLQLAVRAPVDVVVDCTGEPEVGCQVAIGAIEHGKHVVMVNVEADITAGRLLAERARRAGLVYTLADGDQPSLITGLVDWARCLGLEVVAAGKWTQRFSPEVAAARLAATAHPTKSTVTYLDGSKTQIEMASTANATGLTVDVPGMHGKTLRLHQIPAALRPASAGGILARGGVVDFVNAVTPSGDTLDPDLGGGVFVVVTTGSQCGLEAMQSKGVVMSPDGQYALLYRPYHLLGVETPWTIARAVLLGVPTAVPGPVPRVEVVAVAKADLPAGSLLGGLGAADVFGIAVAALEAEERGELPVGLAAGARLAAPVRAGTRLTYGMLAETPDSLAWSLRQGTS